MAIAIRYPHIVKPETGPAHLERLPRIRVAQIAMDYLYQGWSADEICYQYPHLLPSEVHSALAYYFDHQPEIENEIQEEIRLINEWRDNPASPVVRLSAQRMLVKGTPSHEP